MKIKLTYTEIKFVIVFKGSEIIEPEIDQIDYILDKNFKDCGYNFFHTFEYRCAYDNKFIKIANNGEVISTITNIYKRFKSQFYGLYIKKIKNSLKTASFSIK